MPAAGATSRTQEIDQAIADLLTLAIRIRDPTHHLSAHRRALADHIGTGPTVHPTDNYAQ